MAREFSRGDRVAQAIRREIGPELDLALRDSGSGMVTVTDVTVSPDLKHATIYVSVLGRDAVDALATLDELAPRLRHLVAQRTRLRTAPSLKFKLDQSLERGERVQRLLRE